MELVGAFTEAETGKGTDALDRRPLHTAALAANVSTTARWRAQPDDGEHGGRLRERDTHSVVR